MATTNTDSSDPNELRLAAQVLSFRSANKFVQCLLMRPFLMNFAALFHLQFVALEHARRILEAMPVLINLSNFSWVSSSAFNWSSGHLFTAATTFAAVCLSDDVVKAQDLDWFSTVLFDIVNTYELVSQGNRNYTAKICKNLLVAMCNSREKLRERFQKRDLRFQKRSVQPPSPQQSTTHDCFNSDEVVKSNPSLNTELGQQSGSFDDSFFSKLLYDSREWMQLTADMDFLI